MMGVKARRLLLGVESESESPAVCPVAVVCCVPDDGPAEVFVGP